MSALVEAVWQGPFDAEFADGTLLRPGDKALIPKEQLVDNGHWRAAKKAEKKDGDS